METTFCQSCAMPINSDELRGTEKSGAKSSEYCVYCYTDGAFIKPGETMEEMIETCIPHMEGIEPDAARRQMQAIFPTLKRWKRA